MNDRLTEKTNDYGSYNIDQDFSPKDSGGYDINFGSYTLENLVEKLGKLEDIEDELGIDLITFVKLTKAEEIYDIEEDSTTTFTYIDFENHLIVCVDEFDEMSGRNFEWSYRFKDYGKTWALTKKELEKGSNDEQHN